MLVSRFIDFPDYWFCFYCFFMAYNSCASAICNLNLFFYFSAIFIRIFYNIISDPPILSSWILTKFYRDGILSLTHKRKALQGKSSDFS